MSGRRSDSAALSRTLTALCVGFGSPQNPAGPEDWRGLVDLSRAHGVRPLLWLALSDDPLPDPVRAELRAVYALTRVFNERLRDEQERVAGGLRRAGVDVWPLKGVDLNVRLYDDIGARELSDIDLLIQPEDLCRADEVLRRLDYRPWRRYREPRFGSNKEVLFVKRAGSEPDVLLDLHQRLRSIGGEDALAEAVFREGWSPHVELAYLCMHQVAHRFSRLRYACDLQRWLQRDYDADWDAFVKLARATGYGPGIWLALRLQLLLGCSNIPDTAVGALQPGRARRALLEQLVGDEPVRMIATGPGRTGPAGAFLMLACARGPLQQIRHLRAWLLPPREDLHLAYGRQEHRSLLRLYVDRVLHKASGSAPPSADGSP